MRTGQRQLKSPEIHFSGNPTNQELALRARMLRNRLHKADFACYLSRP